MDSSSSVTYVMDRFLQTKEWRGFSWCGYVGQLRRRRQIIRRRDRGSRDSLSWRKAKLTILKMDTAGESTARKLSRTAPFPGTSYHMHNLCLSSNQTNPKYYCIRKTLATSRLLCHLWCGECSSSEKLNEPPNQQCHIKPSVFHWKLWDLRRTT